MNGLTRNSGAGVALQKPEGQVFELLYHPVTACVLSSRTEESWLSYYLQQRATGGIEQIRGYKFSPLVSEQPLVLRGTEVGKEIGERNHALDFIGT